MGFYGSPFSLEANLDIKNIIMKKDSKKSGGNLNIIPLADRVLVKELTENETKKTESGIIIPDSVKEDKGAKRGRVVAVGAGRYDDGKLIPVSVKVGDTVLFQWGDKLTVKGEEYHMIRETEIIAKVK